MNKMVTLEDIETIEAVYDTEHMKHLDSRITKNNIVRAIVYGLMNIDWVDIQEAKMKREVKEALMDFQNRILEIQNDALLSKHKY